MKVSDFKAKYESIQEQARDINDRVVPLLKELKKLGKQASSLAWKADFDKGLYKEVKGEGLVEDGWNIAILHRLAYLNLSEEVDSISNSLYNVIHTPFVKEKVKQCKASSQN